MTRQASMTSMKGFPIAHIFHPSIPPMHAVVNNHNRNIDYWTVKRKFAEIVSTNDVNKIYSISNELRRVLSAITALNFYQGDIPSVMIRIQPENMSPFIIDISTGEHDDYIIQTLDVGTFAPFGEQCICSAVNKKELECIKETISKYCVKDKIMFPVSSIGNDISSDLVRRKMNDLPESPTGNNLEALAPGIEKLKQTSIEMVTLLNTLQPGGKCIITGDFQKELAYLQNVILYNVSSLRLDFLGYNAQIIQRSDNTCELTINEPLKNQEISTGNININCPLKDIYNEIRRLNVIFSCGTGDIVDLSSLDLRNVDLDYYDFTDKHMANTILNPFKLNSTNFTNANMFQVNFVSSTQNATIPWDYLLKITPVLISISDMYSEEKIKFVESCLNEPGDITEEQLKIMRFAIIKSIPRATLTDKLENELTKEIYKSSSKIINCLNRIKLPEMKEFSSEKIYDYIDIIIEDYENIKENAYLVVPQINYTMDLNIEDSSSEELLSDNTLEKDENSPDNGFEVGEYNTYEAYNSEKQYFTREDYTYDYDLLNAI